jgi:hypothetical protein
MPDGHVRPAKWWWCKNQELCTRQERRMLQAERANVTNRNYGGTGAI